MPVTSVAIAYDCLFPYTTGGGERQYRAFATELAGRGLTVDYLTARQWTGAAPEEPGFRVVAATGPLRLYSADGVRRSTAAAAFAWGLFRTLRRRRHRYDAVIVSALPVLNVFAARAALAGTRTTLIADYLEVWRRPQWIRYAGRATGTLAWFLQRLAIALTPVATAHSQLSAGRLRAEGLRGRLLVSPGLIEGGGPEPETRDAASPPFVLYVGRHIPDKRVECLPAAVAVARERIPDLRLVILGEGPSAPEVRAAIQAADGDGWTDLPGFVSQERLDELMATAACLVNPSRREGYGLVVVESAARGTPVVLVADEGNASTELIEAGRNGHVAASAAPRDLGDAIGRTVTGAGALRRSTSDWYREALATRTIRRTIDAIVDTVRDIRGAGDDRPRAERAENK